MTITHQLRDQTFASASEAQQRLYTSEETIEFSATLSDRYGLEYAELAEFIGDVALGLVSLSDLPTMLTEKFNAPPEHASMLAGEIQTYITNGLTDLSADIAETEAALQAVPAIRTMAGDIAHSQHAQPENVYTSSQETLLKKPTHNFPKDESRWGNQT
jgi:hypothetical protein